MNILIAEDESAISMQYRIVLEDKGHSVTTCENGEECVKLYRDALGLGQNSDDDRCAIGDTAPAFDAVILDYRMPKKDGLAAAIEIFDLCSSQRIIFASAYTAETLKSAVKNLHRVVELLHKPFDLEYFVDAVEDQTLYHQLEKLNARVREMKDHDLTYPQLVSLLDGAKAMQKLVLHSC